MNATNKRTFWQKQLTDCAASGLSQKVYCSQESLKLSTFNYWRKRLRTPDDSCGKLIRVPLSSYNASICITVSGFKMEIPVDALEQVLPIILRSQQDIAGC